MDPGRTRDQWSSRLGFILAASGSAIGLGNIVFFSANAYKYGAGAFYVPYLIALFLIGIPVMILEFGLGHHTGEAFPQSLRRVGGRLGEFAGWWGIMNAGFITMYYITILAWVLGMLFAAFGERLWSPSVAVEAFGMAEGAFPNPTAYFLDMISEWKTAFFVVVVWALNVLIIIRGTRSIEMAVKFFVPAMWIFMIILIVRGVTLPEGIEGVKLLFTPRFDVMTDPEVWQGAFSQMFFTLSLGFGIMTAYASYLPRNSDQTANAMTTSLLNCSFEFLAGIAIFSMLFSFAIAPKASTLAMMFFIVPRGIAQFPALVGLFGALFFLLLLLAGLSSSISLIEALAAAAIDKFRVPRMKVVLPVAILGTLGSIGFAIPIVVDKGFASNGTLGLTLLDLIDHWAFSYGLLVMGLVECVLIGWGYGVSRIRATINEHSKFRLGPAFDYLVQFVIPGLLLLVLLYAAGQELENGLYGNKQTIELAGGRPPLEWICFLVWIVGSATAALVFTLLPGRQRAKETT